MLVQETWSKITHIITHKFFFLSSSNLCLTERGSIKVNTSSTTTSFMPHQHSQGSVLKTHTSASDITDRALRQRWNFQALNHLMTQSVEASVALFAVESQEHTVSESLNEHIEYSVDKNLMRQNGDGYVGQKRERVCFRFLWPGVLSSSLSLLGGAGILTKYMEVNN